MNSILFPNNTYFNPVTPLLALIHCSFNWTMIPNSTQTSVETLHECNTSCLYHFHSADPLGVGLHKQKHGEDGLAMPIWDVFSQNQVAQLVFLLTVSIDNQKRTDIVHVTNPLLGWATWFQMLRCFNKFLLLLQEYSWAKFFWKIQQTWWTSSMLAKQIQEIVAFRRRHYRNLDEIIYICMPSFLWYFHLTFIPNKSETLSCKNQVYMHMQSCPSIEI